MIEQFVSDLPEVYQPIYGHPNLSTKASRGCEDRLTHIIRIHDKLSSLLNRPLKVLDLGCAQGFFSFNLAACGAIVHGIDCLDKNIALCNALAEANKHLAISFETGRVENIIERLQQGEYDLVLGLSVFHHIIHEKGIETVKKLLKHAANQSGGLIVEFALKEEPLYWGPSQPEDPSTLLDSVAFVHEHARHDTHLAPISRPLFAASNRYWILDDDVRAFDHSFTESHAHSYNTHKGTRRYFFNSAYVLKMYRLNHPRGAFNETELTREAHFLQNPPADYAVPTLITHGKNENSSWLVEERVKGRPLLDLLQEGAAIDRYPLVLAVLAQLAKLEASGLYHDDVRTWNILVAEDNAVHLIDYGSISTKEKDCNWPENLFLSFLIFVNEVALGTIKSQQRLRIPPFSPFGLPEPYYSWVMSLCQKPITEWSFEFMHQKMQECQTAKQEDQSSLLSTIWMTALEERLQMENKFIAKIQDKAMQANKRAARAEERAGHLAAAAHSAQRQYQSVIQSRTWRMTLPVRKLIDFAKWFIRGVVAWLTFKPGSRPWRTARRLLSVTKNKISSHPRLKHFILKLLQIVAGKNVDVKIALLMHQKLASLKPIDNFNDMLDEYLHYEVQPDFRLIFGHQNEIEPNNYQELLAKKCDLFISHQLIKAVREDAVITLKKTVDGNHFDDVKQIVVHIYLALLRRYPSDDDAAHRARNLIKNQNIMNEIQSIKQSKEFKTLGYRQLKL